MGIIAMGREADTSFSRDRKTSSYCESVLLAELIKSGIDFCWFGFLKTRSTFFRYMLLHTYTDGGWLNIQCVIFIPRAVVNFRH